MKWKWIFKKLRHLENYQMNNRKWKTMALQMSLIGSLFDTRSIIYRNFAIIISISAKQFLSTSHPKPNRKNISIHQSIQIKSDFRSITKGIFQHQNNFWIVNLDQKLILNNFEPTSIGKSFQKVNLFYVFDVIWNESWAKWAERFQFF